MRLTIAEIKEQVFNLRKRAEIRRRIRKEEDRIAKQLEEAADTIEDLLNYMDRL